MNEKHKIHWTGKEYIQYEQYLDKKRKTTLNKYLHPRLETKHWILILLGGLAILALTTTIALSNTTKTTTTQAQDAYYDTIYTQKITWDDVLKRTTIQGGLLISLGLSIGLAIHGIAIIRA